MPQCLVIRICRVLLSLYGSCFWMWAPHGSGVLANSMEEYAASIFMVNVTGSTSPLICHGRLKSAHVRLLMNAVGTAGCFEDLLVMVCVRRQHKEVFWSEMATHDQILKCVFMCMQGNFQFLFTYCLFSDSTQCYTVSVLLLKNFMGCRTYNLLIESTNLPIECKLTICMIHGVSYCKAACHSVDDIVAERLLMPPICNAQSCSVICLKALCIICY